MENAARALREASELKPGLAREDALWCAVEYQRVVIEEQQRQIDEPRLRGKCAPHQWKEM